jgi:hypothetical protein
LQAELHLVPDPAVGILSGLGECNRRRGLSKSAQLRGASFASLRQMFVEGGPLCGIEPLKGGQR